MEGMAIMDPIFWAPAVFVAGFGLAIVLCEGCKARSIAGYQDELKRLDEQREELRKKIISLQQEPSRHSM